MLARLISSGVTAQSKIRPEGSYSVIRGLAGSTKRARDPNLAPDCRPKNDLTEPAVSKADVPPPTRPEELRC